MKNKIIILIMIIFTGITIGDLSIQTNQIENNLMSNTSNSSNLSEIYPIQTPIIQENLSKTNTKLDIVPQYSNVRLQPGENKEIVVTVMNRNNRTVSVNASVDIQSGYMGKSWISVNPEYTELSAGDSKQFTINISVPSDAPIGNSGAQLAFTNDIIPTPYPQPIPVYVNALQISVEVYTPPKIQIEYPYINGQLEAGKSYEYDVKVKNIGNYAIGISPRLGNDIFPIPYTPVPILDERSITIEAPQSIQAGVIEPIKIFINPPIDARGLYNNYIDLGANDSSILEGDGRISMSLNIWRQPKDSFIKSFNIDKKSQITVEISSNYYNYPLPVDGLKEPSFDVSLVGPDGESVLRITKTVTKGNVNMGGDTPILQIENESYYQNGNQYVYTYKTDVSPGKWKLKILSKNVPSFDYSITTENIK